jgi:hypothetical protein
MKIRTTTSAAFAALLLAMPVAASAKPHRQAKPDFESSQFAVHASNGYKLTFGHILFAIGRRPDAFAYVRASKGTSLVEYSVRAKPRGHNGFVARLPGVGRISIRFHEQSRSQRHRRRRCQPGELVRRGLASGVIRLRGENDFTSVDATRARGSVRSTFPNRCGDGTAKRRGDRRRKPGGHSASLTASGRLAQGSVQVLAFRSSSKAGAAGDLALLVSILKRSREGMSITETEAFGGRESTSWFTTASGGHDLSATLEPGHPFAGTAEFARGPGGAYDWTGTLSVAMPISGLIPLAEPSFKEGLCVDSHCVGRERSEARFAASVFSPRAALEPAAP